MCEQRALTRLSHFSVFINSLLLVGSAPDDDAVGLVDRFLG